MPQHIWTDIGGGTDRPARDLVLLGKRPDGATHWPDPRRPLPAARFWRPPNGSRCHRTRPRAASGDWGIDFRTESR
ncbi:hypothetical protein [Nocardia aurantia]|uniref:Uncharacterized protein n=1 Tax=Nocardia aurantia TaxID=2585199 RepID=A0A7K0E0W0_9NOCA|nr:hypothetical protein [Nocardia aurantia]MQY31417.1 hypothetical protein [Nocardia aurantia]